MQSWDYDLLPPPLQPPYNPARLLDKRARLVSEVLELALQDLAMDTPPDTAILLAQANAVVATLCQHTKRDVEEEVLAWGYDGEEEPC